METFGKLENTHTKETQTLHFVLPYNGTHPSYGWTSIPDFEKLLSFYPNITSRRGAGVYSNHEFYGNLTQLNTKLTGIECP